MLSAGAQFRPFILLVGLSNATAATLKEANVPTFISYVSYSQAGIKGLVDKPTDRTEVIRKLVEKAGGKFVAGYMTTGTNDVVLVTEMPDGSDAVAVGMAAAASGAVSNIETVRAWSLGDFKGICEKAGRLYKDYTPPGK
jgi:uncharacterized protein with GYD domain